MTARKETFDDIKIRMNGKLKQNNYHKKIYTLKKRGLGIIMKVGNKE